MRALNAESVTLLSAGQVITCVLDSLKELIENALDAGAKTVQVKIEDLGLRSVTVTDDGSGITKEGREKCALAHTTSKIASFEELSHDLATFGFRGEALHSLCATGDVTIITRCKDEETAERISFDHSGNPVKRERVPGRFGTSVTVLNLLSNFPVRVREERVHFSAENLRSFLSRYFLAAPTVRFVIDAAPHLSMTRPPLNSIMQAVSYEFGPQVAASLAEKQVEGYNGDVRIRVKGVVPSPTCDWKTASTSRMQTKQLILVNGRPVRNSTIEKKVNEACWRRFGSMPRRMPRFVLSIDFFRENQICSSMIDINVDPLKSHVIFSDTTVVGKLVDRIMSFEQQEVRFKRLDSWPSKKLSVSTPELDIASFGTGCEWKDAGRLEDGRSLFSVRDYQNKYHLIAIKTKNLFEQFGVTASEISRAEQAEMVVNYWDQIMELHKSQPRVFHMLQLD